MSKQEKQIIYFAASETTTPEVHSFYERTETRNSLKLKAATLQNQMLETKEI